MFYQLQKAKTKVKVKSSVKLQSGSRFLLAKQIFKILLPTEKITRICRWASAYLQPCFKNTLNHRTSLAVLSDLQLK